MPSKCIMNENFSVRPKPSQQVMRVCIFLLALSLSGVVGGQGIKAVGYTGTEDSLWIHKLVLDKEKNLLPWFEPATKAYDAFLRARWNFIKTSVPNAPGPGVTSHYPQYYFYCAYWDKNNVLEPDGWMNDIGEKIPNWFESARLYYAYTGDASVMKIVKDFSDYDMDHGRSQGSFAWPYFPFATADAGDSLYRGFTTTDRFSLYETQVDHSGEIGLTYLKMYFFYHNDKYLNAAVKVADVLASRVRAGSLTKSPWPYIVNASSGVASSEYGTNWTGCYMLLDKLARLKLGNHDAYEKACVQVRNFLLNYPLKTGYWTDGHTDYHPGMNNKYRSNLSASNFSLFLFDYPEFDPDWKTHIPELIKWTEEFFVDRSAPGETGHLWGVNIVGEQDEFLYKMDYQTARYAATCARWYAVSGDASYKEKAFRALNFVTYCSDENGKAYESILSLGISNWWSDCYGEGPRMFYRAFAAIPEWTPGGEDHILYSESILSEVHYEPKNVSYTATEAGYTDYLHLSFEPSSVTIDGKSIPLSQAVQSYSMRKLNNGDFAVEIHRREKGRVIILGK